MSFEEKLAQKGVPPSLIFGFSLLFVFLILAALYESWSLPFSVLLSTPVAVFGAFALLYLRRIISGAVLSPSLVQIENNVYAQIGLVMVIGLVAKNAILIVEFAKTEFERGTPLVEAALTGARLRLRPILMTSFAFILGCLPLWMASGSGAVARQVMGKVKRWREGAIVVRRTAAGVEVAASKFRRIKRYRELPILIEKLGGIAEQSSQKVLRLLSQVRWVATEIPR